VHGRDRARETVRTLAGMGKSSCERLHALAGDAETLGSTKRDPLKTMSRLSDSVSQETREPVSRVAVGETLGLNKGASRARALVHLSEHQSRYAHPHRDRRESPLRSMEENFDDRLPALWAGAQNLRAEGLYRKRTAGCRRPVAPRGLSVNCT
jgi:hypothetical protein